MLWAATLLVTAAGAYAIGVRRGAEPAAAHTMDRSAERRAPPREPEGGPSPPPPRVGAPTNVDETRTSDALAALASSDAAERSRGLLALAKEDRAQAVSRARELLADPTMIRAAAAVLLTGGGTPEDIQMEIPRVQAALDRCKCDGETKAAVTGTILRSASYASPASARKLAVELVSSKSPEVRRAAIPLLQSLDADTAVPLLLAALDDPDPGARQAAFTTLRAFSHHDHGDSAEAWRAWWRTANAGR
ncbi:Hypothetical protein A7982_02589 [Minicystis rosea]|nr:Hypothetical protein A7982_02589 [Minicystis rosea]